VNKVATAAHLRFDAAGSPSLPDACKARLLALKDQRVTDDGIVVIKAQQYRSLERNRAAALERLRRLILVALDEPKPRKPTKRPVSAERRRLAEKAHRAELKRRRSRPAED